VRQVDVHASVAEAAVMAAFSCTRAACCHSRRLDGAELTAVNWPEAGSPQTARIQQGDIR